MSDIADGTYIIRNVANKSLGVNSKGATDGNGENVWLYTVNKLHDGTYVNVQTKDDGNGNTWRILTFPATGKAISVSVSSGGIPAQGDNVYQWDVRHGSGGGEQKWDIDDTGTTTTYDGNTYEVYKIFMTVTKSGSPYVPRLLEYQGTGTPASGGNLCVAGDESTSQDQMWIFEPAEPVFPGTYRIVPRTDSSYCCYVNGASKSHGARIGVQPWTGAANQVWYVEQISGGRVLMRPVHSFGDFATYATNTATLRDQCCQDNHGPSQTDHQWIPYPMDGKTVTIDGSSYQCYEVSIYAGVGDLVLDIPSNQLSNWLQIYTANGTDAQMWAFVPADAVDSTLPVPAGVGITFDGENHREGTAPWDSTDTINPIWSCPGTKFQARYRVRPIGVSDTGTETYPEGWSGWKSVADGSESNDGWGTAWLPNQTFNSPADFKTGTALDIDALTAVNPACDVEVEVRYFTDEWGDYDLPAHGDSASGTVRLYTPIDVDVTSVTRTGEGLVVAFTSDWAVGGTTATVKSMSAGDGDMVDPVSESGKYAASDTITIPWTDIDQFVAIGDSVDLTLDLVTSLGVAGTVTYSGTVVDGGDQGVTVSTVETEHASYIITVPHDPGESTQLLMLNDGQKPTNIPPSSTSDTADTYDMLVPLNQTGDYEVIVDGFAVKHVQMAPIKSHFSVWTFGDGDWAVLDYGRNQLPTQDDKQDRDHDEYQLTAREYHAYRKRVSMDRDLSVTGSIIEKYPEHGTRAAFMRLLKEGHAIYRNIRGEIHSVFVSNISIPLEDSRFTDVTVTQHSETR